ncbi:TonB-dependent receptor [Ideonella azotifigens]|uniref:TonB-dependent receptor n=1 Tax=Ideonella azotifigens TaxID=513160 RepID=A0ABP3VWN0_9BURK|nr:TonB-dependent receptor [Ideonella azotifigens]MCD2343502.1 TonB-dependent receptor [Ideonella azotifigens]
MKLQLNPVAAAALFVVSTAALSQTAPAPAAAASAPDDGVQQVEVTGIRASMQQSLQSKRNSSSRVEVITAEDVGKMPDKNVADSLQRIPGVTTTSAGSAEGSFGENEHVQLRGLSSQLTLTTLNGHLVSTGDWYGPNIAAGGRSVTFTLLPSDLIGKVTVNKSSRADLPEGGAAGTVDIDTRHPLDFKKTLSGVASLEAAHSDAAKKTDPSLSALINWKNNDSTFGILGQVFSQTRHLQRAGSEGVWWDKTPATYPISDLAGKNVSYLSGAVLFEQERKREGGYLEAQLKVDPRLSFNLSGFYSTVDAKNYNTNFMADTVNPFNGPGWNGKTGTPTGDYTVTNGTISSVFFGKDAFANNGGSAGAFSAVEDVAIRPDAKTDSKFINLDGKWLVSDKLTLTSKIGTTNGGARTKDVGFEVWSGWDQGTGYTVNKDGILILNVPGGDTLTKTGAGIGGWGSYTSSSDRENYAQLDATLRLDNDLVHTLKWGARATAHRRSLTKLGMTLAAGAASEDLITDDAITHYSANWYGGLPVNPTPGFSPWKIRNDFVVDWMNQYATFTTHATQQEFDIKEKTGAGYVMAEFSPTDKVSGDFGVRVVRTNEDIDAFLPGGAPNYKKSFTDVLPSLNLRADLAKDLVGRLALNRGLSRPDFGQLAGNDLRDLQHNGVGSNPYLDPIRSNNLDLSAEWYFGPKSLLAVGFFASKLDGVIAYGHQQLEYQNASNGNAVEVYDISSPVNTQGRVTGFELAFQHTLGLGFGVDLNYTRSNGKQTEKLATGTCNGSATEDCTLYGTSKDVYNIGAFYENDSFSARLAYSHRSTYKLGNRGGADYFQNGNGQLNLALNYNVNDMFALTFEAQNLTDPLLKVYKTDTTQVAGVYKAGKMYFGGVRVKF